VPVVTIDRRVAGVEGITAHVGADNVKGGEAQGQWVLANYPNGANIINLQGQPGASPAIDRNKGLHNVLDQHKDKYSFVFEQTANFARDKGLSVTEAGLAGMAEAPDVIVAANDDMALGAMEAVKARALEGKVAIIGFDALPEAIAAAEGSHTGRFLRPKSIPHRFACAPSSTAKSRRTTLPATFCSRSAFSLPISPGSSRSRPGT